MQLTKEQRIFIVLEYEATKNCEQVIRGFNETFPERNSPDKKTVYRTVRKINEHGSILSRNKGNSERKITQRTENNITIVQRAINENPAISVRRNETNLSSDYARRKAFCNWFISKDQRFTERLVVTDEAAFSMDGRVNNQILGSGVIIHQMKMFSKTA